MNGKIRNRAAALLAGSLALCLGGALVCVTAPKSSADAAETYAAFVNVGADDAAKAIDQKLGLADTAATADVAGEVHTGSTLFGSYATGATYKMAVSAGSYRVSIAVKAEAGKSLTVDGAAVSLDGKEGNAVVYKDVTVEGGADITVAYTGDLCGVLVSSASDNVMMAVDYPAAQVIQYGALFEEALEPVLGYYADGTTEALATKYEEVNAGTGIDVNFTTVDFTGKVEALDLDISRTVITMPDGLVYFINCGSHDEMLLDPTSKELDPSTLDTQYYLNQVVADYYGNLLNDKPNQDTTKGGAWGIYDGANNYGYGASNKSGFPYNTFDWTGNAFNKHHEAGYMLSDLDPNQSYRIYFGTQSHWHSRTVNITFNGSTIAGNETLRIPGAKSFTVISDVKPDSSGKIDIHMTQVGDQNEPTLCFIAVQPMSVEVADLPAAVEGPTIVGLEDHSITVNGISAGSKIVLYNNDKPYQLLYEEKVDEAKLEGSTYTVDWGEPFEGITQFRMEQVTSGGAGGALTVTITDITYFNLAAPTQHTVDEAYVSLKATATSGVASWSYRFGEYGEEIVTSYEERPGEIDLTFKVTENGSYYVVVTSGLGATYAETVTVNTISKGVPVINITPAKEGWNSGAYHVTVTVDSVAPVAEYRLAKDGKTIDSDTELPDLITLDSVGEYTVFVTTAAGQTAVKSVRVSDSPVTTVVRGKYERRTLTYSFGDSKDYIVRSVTVYQVTDSRVTREMIGDGNTWNVVNGAGKYVAIVTATDGSVEMFAIDVTSSDLSPNNTGTVIGGVQTGDNGVALGVGLGVGIGGVVIAAVAVVVVLLLTKKKKS